MLKIGEIKLPEFEWFVDKIRKTARKFTWVLDQEEKQSLQFIPTLQFQNGCLWRTQEEKTRQGQVTTYVK